MKTLVKKFFSKASLLATLTVMLFPATSAAQTPATNTPPAQTKQASGGKKGAVKNFFRAFVPQVTASSPLLQQLTGANPSITVGGGGLQMEWEEYNAVFRNAANLGAIATIVVYEKEVARLKPGQIAVDNRRYQAHFEQIPAMVFYNDATTGEFVGMSYGKISFYPGMPQSQSLLFDRIVTPDGSPAPTSEQPTPLSESEMKEKAVHMPRKWLSGTNGLQIANASEYLVRLSYNGRVIAMLKPGSLADRFKYIEKRVVLGWGINSIQVDYFREVAGGYQPVKSLYDVPLYLQTWGIYGRQLVIGAPQIGFLVNY
ncbi:MAG: hypothetical protein Q8P49_00235 [Candidatus Liptonbacteria bacterium]|nr:hypothetical protein [Candidatus Liptonbacteria bacterium]